MVRFLLSLLLTVCGLAVLISQKSEYAGWLLMLLGILLFVSLLSGSSKNKNHLGTNVILDTSDYSTDVDYFSGSDGGGSE